MSRRPGRSRRIPSRGASAPWSPSDIPGLVLFLDAAAGITLATTEVAAWEDAFASDFLQASGPLQPTFVATDAAFGGRPSVLFSGANDRLVGPDLGALAWVAFVSRHPSTTFPTFNVAMSRGAVEANSSFLIGSSGTANWLTGGGSTMAGTRTRNAVATNTALGTADQPFLYEFVPTTPAAGVLTLGNYHTIPSFGFAGAFTFVFGATSNPSAGDKELLRAWVESECGFDAGAP